MSMFTRRTAAIIGSAAALTLVLGGCSASGDSGSAEGKATEVVFGNSFAANHPHNSCGVDVVAEKVNDAKVGLEIVNYPESILGGDQERFRSVQTGDVQMNLDSPSNISAFSEPIGLLDRAFVLDGPEQLANFIKTDAYKELTDKVLEDADVRVIGAWYFGMRVFTSNKPITEPDDLKGLKTRFPNKPEYLESAYALGANPVGVSFDELYLALQQGTADSQENPVSAIASTNVQEVQDYISLSGHQTSVEFVVVSESFWKGLTDEQRETIQTAVDEAAVTAGECISDEESTILQEWADEGVIEVVQDVDRDAFRDHAETYWDENLTGVQREYYDLIKGEDLGEGWTAPVIK
ncbi:DctP family TRAP transporter solute-binding subunit [Salinibacterium hongtaonis]|uniref:tRNA modification GTPase n=1 Tax=Homoserinimonas hongtaonis TaxID=2079791 RepID=A0A2U1T159_9MICO|nr:DctP family TRAP transporter solute-binding subunit [Salinibacterium hongtaonis]AWB90157.1 tRNA modification GTPase [Salinibacterium hongtaonis]PWB97597.1 tRNA modification GTPase [Salinibacterium hongtaonis]